jgi:hypothetical protein
VKAHGSRLVLGSIFPWDAFHPPLWFQQAFLRGNTHPQARWRWWKGVASHPGVIGEPACGHLPAATLIGNALLWTRDRRLRRVANELAVGVALP